MPIRRLLTVGVLGIFLALLIEQSYRIYLFGLDAFSIAKIDSVENFARAGILQPSLYPDVVFELIPNLDTLFKLASLRTNSAGLADRDYPRLKPKDDFRIVLLGSSFSMPSGVAFEDSWKEVLEKRLNTRGGSRHAEVINFSVGGYDPRQLLATLKYRALDYEPDLILVDVTLNSPWIIRRDEAYRRAFVPQPKSHPFRHSFVLEKLMGRAPKPELTSFLPANEAPAAFERVLGEFRAFAAASGKPLCFVILQHDNTRAGETAALRQQVSQGGACVIDTSPAFANERLSDLSILKNDPHPNARAQRIFAESVFAFLASHRLAGDAE